MYLSYQDYIEHKNKIWRINSAKSGVNLKEFKCWLDQLSAMLSWSSKVFVFRFDLSFPVDSLRVRNDNVQLDKFLTRLKKRIKRHYEGSCTGYSWAGEIECGKNQHYHIVLMLDGRKVQSPNWLKLNIASIWGNVGGSTPTWIKHYRLSRDDLLIESDSLFQPKGELINSHSMVALVFHVSYLFKGRGKGKLYQGCHNYGHSRLKEKPQ
ncbi:hypothetical protein AN944_02636 [Shewanella sp. P1-14-1]|uniref:YagK/YfjJ domain-containing protein n=1 Tax=Shewanella sp. P1-14-1 TaxID=1723761 RepID=UPI0006D67289|nr:inovirus-type Gp2 protein [Shewanella sp. P1-14-1]KPZ69940.1 hypothetical protein AN944_02636 [Shewanella sp. P1-14-1]